MPDRVPVSAHRVTAQREPDAAPPPIQDDAQMLASFLSDAAHVSGGFASGVAFPTSPAEAAALVAAASRVLPVGAQSSLTGGATPRGDLILSTRALRAIGRPHDACVQVDAGVSMAELQARLAGEGWYFPPVPTYDGATVGGIVSTNAAGPATFKYGATRQWVQGLTIILANGDVVRPVRGGTRASGDGVFEIELSSGAVARVPVPTYRMPDVPKLSAGYYAGGGSADLLDLFIGSEGTLGVIVDATLRIIPRPRRSACLVECRNDDQAVAVTSMLRTESRKAWNGSGSLDVCAVEYMDASALALTPDEAFARAGVPRPAPGGTVLIAQIEVERNEDDAFARLAHVLDVCGISSEPKLTLPGDDRGASALLALREAVPAAVNARVAAAKATTHPDIEKTAGDVIVPFARVAESLALYRDAFTRRGLAHAVWGHLSDGNLHPNVIPATLDDVRQGRDAILDIGRGVIALGGAPLAEHGVGRSALKQQLLRELYGEQGIEQMRRVKRALDPEWKLAPGVVFQR